MIFSNGGFLLVASAVVLIWTPLSDGRGPGLIVGGVKAKKGEFPYQVYLQENEEQSCGGSILDNCWILTAAHCVVGTEISSLSIVAGTTKLNRGGVKVAIDEIISHKKFKNYGYKVVNDIALIRLKRCLQFNKYIQPVQLGTNDVRKGYDGIVSGWGFIDRGNGTPTNDLLKLQVRTITNKKCKNLSGIIIVAGNLCTLNRKGQGACNGDSGGPLVDVKSQTLIGVVSVGEGGCAKGLPDVYTRISKYIPWIENTMEKF